MDEYYEEETVNRNSFVFYDSFYRDYSLRLYGHYKI